MTTQVCLLEPFRKQPTKVEIRQCMLKLFALHGELIRQANKSVPKQSLPENALPKLWIITTSASDKYPFTSFHTFWSPKLSEGHGFPKRCFGLQNT